VAEQVVLRGKQWALLLPGRPVLFPQVDSPRPDALEQQAAVC